MPTANKTCPKCGEESHVRRRNCPCGYRWPKKQKVTKIKPHRLYEREELISIFGSRTRMYDALKKTGLSLLNNKMLGQCIIDRREELFRRCHDEDDGHESG